MLQNNIRKQIMNFNTFYVPNISFIMCNIYIKWCAIYNGKKKYLWSCLHIKNIKLYNKI